MNLVAKQTTKRLEAFQLQEWLGLIKADLGTIEEGGTEDPEMYEVIRQSLKGAIQIQPLKFTRRTKSDGSKPSITHSIAPVSEFKEVMLDLLATAVISVTCVLSCIRGPPSTKSGCGLWKCDQAGLLSILIRWYKTQSTRNWLVCLRLLMRKR